jgi:glycosyltransferase involved in cell wall biosynthesis
MLQELELSIVMPCLNEADTVGTCVSKAQTALRENGITGEVVVADNGSTDGSIELAEKLGARVVRVPRRGYGNALMDGIAAARGRYVLMGDADDSYDFLESPRFLAKLREGDELVQGCRLPAGGGNIRPGAMPFSHRWIGNPIFSFMARTMFRAPIHDVYCGLRAFSKEFYNRLGLRCEGMEFATEMIIKASLQGGRIGEVPITLHPDGRTAHPPHLRTLRDGWHTLRFFLVFSPRWLFLYPGLTLGASGVLGYAIALPGLRLGPATFDAHTLLFASLAILLGHQAITFAIFAKTYAVHEGLLPLDRLLQTFETSLTLERGLCVGGVAMLAGVTLLAVAVVQWWQQGFGPLDYSHSMRWVIPGFTLTALGFQTVLGSFFLSILGLRKG